MIRLALSGLTLLLAVVAGASAWVYAGLHEPASDAAADPHAFTIEEGEPLGSVALRLDQDGLLPKRALFGPRVLVWFARLQELDREVKAGDYELHASMTPLEILEKLCSGQVRTYPVTIPEGLHVEDVAGRLEAAGIAPSDELVRLARSPAFARELGVEADDLEGYLFPETYRFRRDTPAREVLETLVGELFSSLTEADRRAIDASGRTLHEIVTLASIVEKETAVPEERPLIAAVFSNRLRQRMRLQTDPTVIYGILRTRGSFDGNLRRVDLRTDTPYNTYTRGGLPPGPIASVGLDSIRAVLDPADVDYLYFVSRNDGTHYFSSTLRQHNNAVIRYQKRGRSGG